MPEVVCTFLGPWRLLSPQMVPLASPWVQMESFEKLFAESTLFARLTSSAAELPPHVVQYYVDMELAKL